MNDDKILAALLDYEGKVTVAAIAASVSLLAAVFSVIVAVWTQRKNAELQKELEKYKRATSLETTKLQGEISKQIEDAKKTTLKEVEEQRFALDNEKSALNARRSYEFDAKKRLYQELEPLLFQLLEAAENAQQRIRSLARSARRGNIKPDGTGWLYTEGYYLRSTIYFLLAPLGIYRLIQNRLALVDLTLDPRIEAAYRILREASYTLTADFDLARVEPALEYDPDAADWMKKRKAEPAVYWQQGLPIGRLDSAIDAALGSPTPASIQQRCTFGEFELEYLQTNSKVNAACKPFSDMFFGFHPKSRPVLWRILITQAYQYEALIAVLRNRTATPAPSLVAAPSLTGADAYMWSNDESTNAELHRAVHEYIDEREIAVAHGEAVAQALKTSVKTVSASNAANPAEAPA